MNIRAPHLFRQEVLATGTSTSTASSVVSHYQTALKAKVRPIYSLKHLSRLTGAEYVFLREIVQRSIDPYEEITRRKRDGSLRSLSSPQPVLMDVQRWILHNTLKSIASHERSYAYQEGKSIVDCARVHVGASWLVKLDLHNYFPSIGEERVYGVFEGLGYPHLLAFELARLCTRTPQDRYTTAARKAAYPRIPSYAVTNRGTLPQGGPTSGALANAVTTRLDVRLQHLAETLGAEYSRYSDDLTFSGDSTFTRRGAQILIREATRAIESEQFSVHEKKTRVVPPGARHVLLGLLVDKDEVRLLPEFRRRIRNHIRAVHKFGLVEHARHRSFDSVVSFVNHIEGCLAYAAGVEPDWCREQSQQWAGALEKWGFPSSKPVFHSK